MKHNKILIVEDEAIIAAEIQELVINLGYDVCGNVNSGEAAIEKAMKEHPDVMLMDVKLKGKMDGIEVAYIIRSNLHSQIIFITAFVDEEKLERAKVIVPGGYLLKPVQERELKIAIEMALYASMIEAERKQVEIALKDSEERYRTLAENLPDFITRYDKDCRHVYVSPNVVSFSGIKAEDYVGKTHRELGFSEEHVKLWDAKIRKLFETAEPQELEFKHDGIQSPRWYNWRLKPEYDAEGNIEYALGITIDITERKQAEEEQNRLITQLNQSQKMEALGTMAGGIAHEFNNLLYMMLGNTDLIKNKLPTGSPIFKNVDNIMQAGNRTADLIKQILTFSRKDYTKLQTVDIVPVVEEVNKLIRATIPTTIDIKTEISIETGVVDASPIQIQQVIINICKNAEHAMPDGGSLHIALDKVNLTKKMTAPLKLNAGLHLQLKISDTGSGIPPENMDRIFDPFFTTKEVGEGTGLGLSVIHGIIEKHKGKIKVESKLESGTIFTIYLPCLEIKVEKQMKSDDKVCEGQGEKILLVDDEKNVVSLLKIQLELLKYSVMAETSSKKALSLFVENDFDLLITDQEMPELSGLELINEIRKIKPACPVILMTGYSSVASKKKVEQMGCRHVLKPILNQVLSKLIREELNK